MQKIEKANSFFRLIFLYPIFTKLILITFLVNSGFVLAQKVPLVNSRLTGRVIDAKTKMPLPAALVQIEGVTNQTQTDNDGKFSLVTGQSFPYNLIVSYMGYEKQKVAVSGSPIVIALNEITNELSGIVVTGYGVQKKQDFTGSSARVSAKQIENRPAQSFDQLIGGQAAGVSIVQPSGVLNATPVFRIRGVNSISSGIYPLVVIDGVPSFSGQQGGNVGNNPLSNLNPNDIESIDVLKDASATAIYGSRAANGVVVVTTKKGKQGKTKVNYSAWVNVSTPTNMPRLLNAEQYVTIKNEAMVNAGKPAGYALQNRSNGSTVNTNWYDVAYQTGVSQNHNINFSGANETTNYFVSLAYGNQNGILRTNDLKQKTARVNLEHKLLSSLTLGTHVNYNNTFGRGPATGSLPGQYIQTDGLARMTYILPPNVAVYNEDGSYNIQDKQRVGYGANNATASNAGYVGNINAYNLQLILDLDKYSSESNALMGDVYAELEILKGLKLKTSYGLNQLNIENLSFQNGLHGDAGAANGSATNTNSRLYRTDWANTLTFNRLINEKHAVSALLGYEEILTKTAGWGATRSGLSDPFFTSYQGGFTNITPTGNSQGENGFQSYFANVNYSYLSKYLFSYSFRRDGYSGLPVANRFGDFNGGSIGWVVSEENFYKNSPIAKVVNKLKIKASYGEVGNINIGNFPSLGLYTAASYNGNATLGFSQAGNSNLKWETSKKSNVGLALSFLNDKLTFEADYFHNKVDGLILDAKQAPSKGIPDNVISANVGELYNKGFEFVLSSNIIQKEHFKWNANINFSTIKNKVTKLFNGSDIYTPSNFGIQNLTREGYSIGAIWAVPTNGVNPDNGNRIFVNRNNEQVQYNHSAANKWTYLDGSIASAIDNYLDGRIQGSSLPTYYGGLNNTFNYKRFDLDLGLVFSGGNKMYNGTRANLLDQRYFNNGTFVLNRWTTPGQVTDIPKLYYSDNVSTGFSITNSTMVENGDYLKLKNVSLGYRLPAQQLFNGKISTLRVYVQATNLFTLTKYTGSDPEVSINGNSVAAGKDHNTVVNARTFAFGLNLQF